MEHIKIIQGNTLADTEEVSKEIIQKLYDFAASGDLDASSEMKGRLHLTAGYRAQAEYLHQMFPNLIISIDDYIIPFEDPKMLAYLNSIGVGSNGMITESQAAAATVVANSQNTEVTKFNELRYFTGVTESNGGWDGAGNGVCRFINWTALEEVDISNFTSIGHKDVFAPNDSFYGCTSLKKVTASNKLTKIGRCAFLSCSNLEEISGLSGTVLLDSAAFGQCTKLTSEPFNNCEFILNTSTGVESMFDLCKAITSIVLNSNVTVLPQKCFRQCISLENLNLSNITVFGNDSLSGCKKLPITTANTSPLITAIGASAFAECELLTSLNFDNVVSIGQTAFRKSGITSVDLSNTTIQSVPYECFKQCASLATVSLPSSCTELGNSAFEQCSNLAAINLSNITSLGNAALSTTHITGNLTLNLTSIGEGALYSTHLTSVDFSGSTFTVAEKNLFSMCIAELDHVIFPSTVTTVRENCFYNCQHLSYIVLPTTSTITWEANKHYFVGVPSTCIIYVDDSKVSEVTTALSGKFNGQIKGISEMPTT